MNYVHRTAESVVSPLSEKEESFVKNNFRHKRLVYQNSERNYKRNKYRNVDIWQQNVGIKYQLASPVDILHIHKN